MPTKPTLAELRARAAEPPPCPLCRRANFFPSDHHLVPRSRGGSETTTLCRDCHVAVHQTLDNKALEREYNTVEALLAHPELAKIIRFLSKQDPGGRTRTVRARARRSAR